MKHDEDIDRLAHSKDVRVYGDYGAGWRDGVKAAAGLLARPTVEDVIEDLAVELFERSHEPSFSDDRRGMDEAREWAQRIAAGLTRECADE